MKIGVLITVLSNYHSYTVMKIDWSAKSPPQIRFGLRRFCCDGFYVLIVSTVTITQLSELVLPKKLSVMSRFAKSFVQNQFKFLWIIIDKHRYFIYQCGMHGWLTQQSLFNIFFKSHNSWISWTHPHTHTLRILIGLPYRYLITERITSQRYAVAFIYLNTERLLLLLNC